MCLRRSATGIGEIIGPVVRGKLSRAQAEPVQISKHSKVSVEIEPAFEIENSGNLPLAIDPLYVRSIQCELDFVLVMVELVKSKVYQPERLLGFQPLRIIVFRD